ncbi:MAG: hypothetical protein H7267_10835 [Sandarakinorhabdus sp.]|nr:hypothetical protein [Sandarakinorhabdus sp.]
MDDMSDSSSVSGAIRLPRLRFQMLQLDDSKALGKKASVVPARFAAI